MVRHTDLFFFLSFSFSQSSALGGGNFHKNFIVVSGASAKYTKSFEKLEFVGSNGCYHWSASV